MLRAKGISLIGCFFLLKHLGQIFQREINDAQKYREQDSEYPEFWVIARQQYMMRRCIHENARIGDYVPAVKAQEPSYKNAVATKQQAGHHYQFYPAGLEKAR